MLIAISQLGRKLRLQLREVQKLLLSAIHCNIKRIQITTVERCLVVVAIFSFLLSSCVKSSVVCKSLRHPQVEELDIRHNTLSDDGVYLVCSVIPKITKALHVFRSFSTGGTKTRNANAQEKQLLQNCLDAQQGTVTRVVIVRRTD